MANKITIYPKPEHFRALSYTEVRDRIGSFEVIKEKIFLLISVCGILLIY